MLVNIVGNNQGNEGNSGQDGKTAGGNMGYKIQPVKKTRKFGGKAYHWQEYVRMKSEAESRARELRRTGKAARVVPQPGYGQGGWNIYVRRGKEKSR